jgi:hypothetical protein
VVAIVVAVVVVRSKPGAAVEEELGVEAEAARAEAYSEAA